MTELLPCPFCGSEIKHVESWARSFDPPRLYHEWHHIENGNCWIRNWKSIVASSDEKPESIRYAVDTWNARASGVAQAPVTDEYEFPYQRTFDAIAAATEIYPSKEQAIGLSISVKKFQEAFNGHRDKRALSLVPSTDRGTP